MSSAPQVFNAAYINALRQGDPATEIHFVNHFSPILLRKLRRNLRAPHLAEDLQQETFLRVLTAVRSGRSIRKPERFEVYVLGVCNHVLRENWRKQRQAAILQPLDIDVPGNYPSAYALVLAQETKNGVRQVLSRLDESEQGILQAILMDEQNKDDICRRYGVNRNYLRLLLYRAKKEFVRRAGEKFAISRAALACPHSAGRQKSLRYTPCHCRAAGSYRGFSSEDGSLREFFAAVHTCTMETGQGDLSYVISLMNSDTLRASPGLSPGPSLRRTTR